MRTLVIVQAHRSGQEVLRLLAQHFLLAKADLAGVDELESAVPCWPGCFRVVCAVDGGKPMLQAVRLAEVVKVALATRYDRFVITEYDSLFLGRVPDTPPTAFCACVVGQAPQDWNVGGFPMMKPPFIANRPILETWLRAAESLIAVGKIGNGTAQMFVTMCCHKALLHIYSLGGVHSLNGTRKASDLVIARKRATEGLWHLHGVKREDHLNFILQKSDALPVDAIME